ncbi:RNase P modulator RnpM [Schnuerera sp.]|uniref:RNase P modulator RnpM n=1 Tax=Schnuerera sp. TaxID=2794844 RepID=UPI002C8BEB7C|nr:YlxR family protein [Schnuerera sp.]HSH34994.1 YlxR family protein [Schnuerera sp.]
MKKKKIPLRKCVACNESKPKKELIRVVKDKDGNIDVDLTGKINGRGAYICSDSNCLSKVKKNKKLDKALGFQVPDKIFEKLNDIIGID